MANNSTMRRTCRLCHSSNLELAVSLSPTPIGDNYIEPCQLPLEEEHFPLDLMHCRDCGQVQLSHVVSPRLLYPEFPYTTSISIGLPEHFRRYAEEIAQRYSLPKGSLVLEIGSNEGPMLRAFAALGHKVLGIEPAKKISEAATSSGVPTLPEFFTSRLAESIRVEHGPAALVAANNVLANIDDLDDVFEGFAKCLNDDGLVVMESSYWLDVATRNLIDTVYHEHISYFAVRPLKRFGERHGFTLIDVLRNQNKGGSLRLVFQKGRSRIANASKIEKAIAEELGAGIYNREIFDGFRSNLDRNKQALHRLLDGTTKAKVAGFGASVGTTTLVYEYDLTGVISLLLDDNSRKVGKLSPGTHIPCSACTESEAEGITDVVMFAWRYTDGILYKHPYLRKQSRLVMPLPHVSVL